MSKIKRIETATRMSQAVVHSNTVYLAGQVALDAPGASIEEQTQNILTRIDRLLEQSGTSKDKVLSATIWMSDIADFDKMNSVWDAWTSPDSAPARACVESKLAAPQFNVEIGVIAAI